MRLKEEKTLWCCPESLLAADSSLLFLQPAPLASIPEAAPPAASPQPLFSCLSYFTCSLTSCGGARAGPAPVSPDTVCTWPLRLNPLVPLCTRLARQYFMGGKQHFIPQALKPFTCWIVFKKTEEYLHFLSFLKYWDGAGHSKPPSLKKRNR